MTDEYETKLLAEDNTMALHIQEKCKFETLIAALEVARGDASSDETKYRYDEIMKHLSDALWEINVLVAGTTDAAHRHPSSRDLGEACSKKKMGAVG